MNKKGQTVNAAIFTLIFLAIGLVVTGVVLSFGANFVQDEQVDFCDGTLDDNSCYACTNASFQVNTSGTNCFSTLNNNLTGTRYQLLSTSWNATAESLGAMTDVAEGQGTVTTVAILAIVVGLLLGVVALFGFMRGRENQI